MTVKVHEVEVLKEYFSGVVKRAEHHAQNVNEIIYSLLGLIILNIDENSDIEVGGNEGVKGNCLWFNVNKSRYALRYEHSDDTIEIREKTRKGNVIAKIDNSTSVSELKNIFDNLGK